MPSEPSTPSFYAKLPHRPPGKPKNAERRSREYLLPTEVERLMQAARSVGRHPDRDAAMILLAYRHGLRVSELVGLRWSQVDFKDGRLHVNRRKNGVAAVHPLRAVELRALRKLQKGRW